MSGGSITILDPVSLPQAIRLGLNARPKSMDGIRIAVVDNTKPNFNIFMDRVQAILEERYGAKFLRHRKPGRTVGVAPEIIQKIKTEFDFAITGLGD